MTYLQTHRRPYQGARRAVIIAAGVVVLVVILVQVLSPGFFPGLFTAIARPFWRVEFAVNSGELLSAESLLDEKEVLERRMSEMQIRLSATEALEKENMELKALLGRQTEAETSSASGTVKTRGTPKEHVPGILSAVLRHPPVSGYDQLIMDIGRDHGISTSTFVYVQGDVLIGRVADVFRSSSKVRLFTSPGESLSVLIGSGHVAATAIGRGGGQYEAQVSREAHVNEGEFVLADSFDDKPIGIVSAVLLDPTQPFKTVLFAPPINVYQVRWVLAKKND